MLQLALAAILVEVPVGLGPIRATVSRSNRSASFTDARREMKGAEPIEVHDLVSLLTLIQQSEFWMQWRVRCEIGLEWMGGQRTIQFYLDQQPLADTSLHNQLKSVLIKELDIPETSPDAVIRGAGTITRKRNALEIEYEWSETVPYMPARDGGYGTRILMALP